MPEWEDTYKQDALEMYSQINAALMSIVIQNARIYDVLCLLASDKGNRYKQLLDAHEAGSLFGTPPYLNENTVNKWNEE